MTPSHAAAFLLFSFFFISLHACSCRILLPKDADHGQALGTESVVMEATGSKLQDSENVSSINALQPILHQNGRCTDAENTKTKIPKFEERRLQDKTSAAQEIDADDPETDVAEDAVVLDYAHPHRKPPIHNEEN